jgi:predicted lipid-binding transport protein (Tim44 family)
LGWRALFGRRDDEARLSAVRAAALEASQDDPLFDEELVCDRAAALFVRIQRAWSNDDISALRTMVGPELMVEWEARLGDFRRKGWRNEVTVVDGPQVRYVGLENRAGDAEDRAVVLLTARLQDVVLDRRGYVLPNDEGSDARVSEFWTLGKRGGDWAVVSIEQEREGAHHLKAPLVAAPETDDARLRAEAVMELAGADAVANDDVGELLSPGFSGPARVAALDLSLVDGRFALDVLATAVTEIVEGWARAVDGPDDALAAWTTPDALDALLYPTAGGRDRLVIRGLEIRSLTIEDVKGGPPATVSLELVVEGVQYVEDRATTEVLAGNKRRRTKTQQSWTLELSEDPRHPWKVVAAGGVIPRR